MASRPRFSITSEDLPKVAGLMRQLPSWYAGQVKTLFESRLAAFKTEMVARSTSGPLYRQTGRLAGSWSGKVEGETLGTLSAFMASYTDQKSYLHEFGGTVTPKTGSRSWIFIPTDPNRKVNGTAIKSVSQVIDEGGDFINRLSRQFREGETIIAPQAVINGKPSTAWNLVIDKSNVPMFIQVKYAVYRAQLGFFDAGVKHGERMVGKLADFVVDYWKTAA
jgi:hypothetical protein